MNVQLQGRFAMVKIVVGVECIINSGKIPKYPAPRLEKIGERCFVSTCLIGDAELGRD